MRLETIILKMTSDLTRCHDSWVKCGSYVGLWAWDEDGKIDGLYMGVRWVSHKGKYISIVL